jgi:hypothetical protein
MRVTVDTKFAIHGAMGIFHFERVFTKWPTMKYTNKKDSECTST